MAKIKIKASKEAFEKAGKDLGDFVLPPKGYYVCLLKECEAGYSQTDGEDDKTRPRLKCVYEIVGVGREGAPVEENYGNLWDYVSFSKESEWKRAEFLHALGLADGTSPVDMEIDTDEVEGTKVIVRVKHEKGQSKDDPPRAKVQKLLPFVDEDAQEAFGGTKVDGAHDFDTDAEFAETEPDEQDNDVPDPEPEDDNPLLTEEELKAMSLKDIGAVAREFDLDPKAHIVKGADGKRDDAQTIATLTAAILEAQGGDEDDDDPF